MITATIQPLASGRAVLDLDGVPREFANWFAAVAEARRCGVTPHLLPFPSRTPEVLAVSPALRIPA